MGASFNYISELATEADLADISDPNLNDAYRIDTNI
jgi:hypothetical protein